MHSTEAEAVKVVSAIRSRVQRLIARRLADSEILKLSLAASLRNPFDVICVLFGGRVVREVGRATGFNERKLQSIVGITSKEYGTLYGADAILPRLASAPYRIGCASAMRLRVALLERRVVESACARRWCHSATTMHGLHQRCNARPRSACISKVRWAKSLVGELARSDARRIDELEADVADRASESDDHLLPLSFAVSALAGERTMRCSTCSTVARGSTYICVCRV